MFTLYQFSFSHYCEKARWALDLKGLESSVENLLPGLHVSVIKKIAPKSTVPVLTEGETVIQGSGEIISYLDQHYRKPLLTPEDPELAVIARKWEDYLDNEVGVTLRLWFYYYLLPDEERALNFLTQGLSVKESKILVRSFPKIRTTMQEYLGINDETAASHLKRLLAAMDKLDQTLEKQEYLVGDSFTRADLTACSLLGPFVAPDVPEQELLNVMPEPVASLREAHKDRRYFQWVHGMYSRLREL